MGGNGLRRGVLDAEEDTRGPWCGATITTNHGPSREEAEGETRRRGRWMDY
jgi:hypothetical protein